MLPRIESQSAIRYRYKQNHIDGPDITLSKNGVVMVAIECKATKLTFEAQFSDNPEIEAEGKLLELSKGVLQLWKFFARVRSGVIYHYTCAIECMGVVLALDRWVMLPDALLGSVFQKAHELADQEGIGRSDRSPVIISTAQELEGLLSWADEDEEDVFATLQAATEARYFGWMLPQI